MTTPLCRNTSRRIPRLVGLVVACCLLFWSEPAGVSGQTPSPKSKLTTVLSDLAQSVPQVVGDAAPQRMDRLVPLSADTLPTSARDAMRGQRLRVNSKNEVQVYVLMRAVTDVSVGQLVAAGATIELRDPAHRRVQARVPVNRLQQIARLPSVTFVRLPGYPVRRLGAVTTEGDAILNAEAVRQQLSVDGTGVRVGVISDGLKGVFASGCTTCGGGDSGPISTGDLPDAIGIRNDRGVLTSTSGGIIGRSFQTNGDLEGLVPAGYSCAFSGLGAEGTALLEVVHDIAPGAQLAFANIDTDMAFNEAVNYLASTNDVVMDDLGFFADRYDGASSVSANTAAALNNPSYPIRAYMTSVGNAADEHYYGHYLASSVDGRSVASIGVPGRLHLFQRSDDTTDVLGLGPQPYNLISLPTGGEVVIVLTWDDPSGASNNDYDLYLIQASTGRVVARSIDDQSGAGDPLEAIDFVNTLSSGNYYIVVQNYNDSAAAKNLNLFSYAPSCAPDGPRLLAANHHERHNYNTATRSVTAQSDAGGSPVSVISVGAICSASPASVSASSGSAAPNESCLDGNHSTVEYFSSRGPTADGRFKPEITAIDGVSVTGAGQFPKTFFGTSAATPHVAGIAALLLQSTPCLITGPAGEGEIASARQSLRDLILGGAVPLTETVPDATFGFGRADAIGSIRRTLPRLTGPTSITVPGDTPAGASLTAAQLGFSDPNGCLLTRLSWTGGCGTGPGTTMSCPFGTSTVSVAASNNGMGFSPPTEMQITVVR